MPPRKPLQLRPVSPVSAAAPVMKRRPRPKRCQRRRERTDRNKKIIAGPFPKSIWKQFRNLCTTEEKTAQELLEEALTDLFLKYRS